MINASANFHVNLPVILEKGANNSTIVVCTNNGDIYHAPFAYIYLEGKYEHAVQAGIAAFNAAFQAALEIREAAE